MDKKVVKTSISNDETRIKSSEVIQEPKPDVTIVKSQSSVQIEVDSKGSKKYTVKVYDDDPEVACEKAIEISQELDEEIKGGK